MPSDLFPAVSAAKARVVELLCDDGAEWTWFDLACDPQLTKTTVGALDQAIAELLDLGVIVKHDKPAASIRLRDGRISPVTTIRYYRLADDLDAAVAGELERQDSPVLPEDLERWFGLPRPRLDEILRRLVSGGRVVVENREFADRDPETGRLRINVVPHYRASQAGGAAS